MSQNITTKKLLLGASFIVVLGIGGASYYSMSQAQADEKGAQNQQQQAMPVTVTKIKPEAAQIWKAFSANLEAVDYAEIRPQVSGNIVEIKFEDGAKVEKDDTLFVIDPRPYEAEVNQAKADMSSMKNRASLAQTELNRAKELIKTDAISQRIYDERKNAANVAWSDVKSAEARVERAQINLDFAYVKAPISGRLSRAEITEGNLVEAGPNAPLLTSIVSDQGIYADFEVDENTYLNFVRSNAKSLEAENKIPVQLSVGQNGDVFDGFIHSFDNRIDASSGTIRARAYFPNEEKILLPGMFATVKVGSPDVSKKILLTEAAIGTDQDRKFVYVVNDQNMVEYQRVTLGENVKGQRVILSGLNEGDQVITEGIIRIRPGMPVSPQVKSADNSMDTPPA